MRRPALRLVLPLFAATCLCSCDKWGGSATPEGDAAAQQTPAEAAAAAREAVYQQLLRNISPLVTSNVGEPSFNEPAKVYLETLRQYYEKLAALPVTMERVDIAHRVAELTLNLGAHAKALDAYQLAMADFEALPEAERGSVDAMRLQSALFNGTGVCMLHTGRAAEAIPYYEKALAADIAVLRALGVAEGAALPKNNPDANVSRAVTDVLGSYRCLGESHALMSDMEEAREVYQKGIAEMASLKELDLNSGMGIAFVKLLAALGDLENRCGNSRGALVAWVQAANYCNDLAQKSSQPTVVLQARNYYAALVKLVKEVEHKLQEEAARQAPAEAPAEAPAAE